VFFVVTSCPACSESIVLNAALGTPETSGLQNRGSGLRAHYSASASGTGVR